MFMYVCLPCKIKKIGSFTVSQYFSVPVQKGRGCVQRLFRNNSHREEKNIQNNQKKTKNIFKNDKVKKDSIIKYIKMERAQNKISTLLEVCLICNCSVFFFNLKTLCRPISNVLGGTEDQYTKSKPVIYMLPPSDVLNRY